MKPLPPTMREKRRYILARILPRWYVPEDSRLMHQAVMEATTSLWGDAAVAQQQPGVVFQQGDYVIVRCRRGTEKQLAVAMATIHRIGETPVAVRTVAISGTIQALKEQIRVPPTPEQAGEVVLAEKHYAAYLLGRHKVDLIAKSNKSQKLLFFTQKEFEEI